jgi:putative CocE/NonD family hydrolase
VHRDVAVAAADGTPLLADLYQARTQDPQPTVLIRSPYGRRGYHGLAARMFAERGYHVLVQSTRGTSGSGGTIDFDAEAGDGRATADWITGQPWSNGELGTFGSSYLSFTQYALASTRPPQLKAMAIAVWGADRRAGYYPGGSFALDRALSWTWGMGLRGRSPLAMVTERGPRSATCRCWTPTWSPPGTRSASTGTGWSTPAPVTLTGPRPTSARSCPAWVSRSR